MSKRKDIFLTEATTDDLEKWYNLNIHYSEKDALRYLKHAVKIYPEYTYFQIVKYERTKIIKEI